MMPEIYGQMCKHLHIYLSRGIYLSLCESFDKHLFKYILNFALIHLI